MKSLVKFAGVIVIVFASTVARGDILTTGDWYGEGSAMGDWDYSSGVTHADGGDPVDYGVTDAWEFTYTTEAGYFNWQYYLYTYGSVSLILNSGETCQGEAYSHAYAYVRYGEQENDISAYVYIQQAGTGYQRVYDDDGDEHFWPGQNWYFEALDGVYAEHQIWCMAYVPEGESDEAMSHADAWAYGNMSVP